MGGIVKHIFWSISLVCLFAACGKAPAYRIEGNLSHLADSVLYICFETPDASTVDTLTARKGKFEVEKREGEYAAAVLFYNGKTQWVTAYPEKGKKIKISGDARYPELITVKGGHINDALNDFKSSVKKLLEEKYELLDRLDEETASNLEKEDVPSKLANIQLLLSEAAVKYVQDHPDLIVSAILIQTYLVDPEDTRRMDEMLALLSSKVKETAVVKNLEQFSEKVKRTGVGAEAPDFTVKDIGGHTLSLADFENQYLLLSFAAPWCERCKTDNLYLKEIRKAFPENKLGMLTVTLDGNQEEVRRTLRNDSITWHLVADSAGYASMLIDLYGVNAIPRNFLIDDTGKIVLNAADGKEMEETLSELIETD